MKSEKMLLCVPGPTGSSQNGTKIRMVWAATPRSSEGFLRPASWSDPVALFTGTKRGEATPTLQGSTLDTP